MSSRRQRTLASACARRSSLKRFKTYIHGDGLLLKTENEILSVGFHATRVVTASTVAEARANALALVRSELAERGIDLKPDAVLACTRVFETHGLRAFVWKPRGFTFYET